jgi:hypothetical protein
MTAIATTDHDTMRRWAESKGGKPAAVDRTHRDGDVGITRIMFPDNRQSEHQSLVETPWEEFGIPQERLAGGRVRPQGVRPTSTSQG